MANFGTYLGLCHTFTTFDHTFFLDGWERWEEIKRITRMRVPYRTSLKRFIKLVPTKAEDDKWMIAVFGGSYKWCIQNRCFPVTDAQMFARQMEEKDKELWEIFCWRVEKRFGFEEEFEGQKEIKDAP